VSRWISTIVLCLSLASGAAAISLPPGFQDEVVLAGLQLPTEVRFSPDGRIFVAEKSGLILAFDGLGDPTPTVFADLRRQVFNAWDRGLIGFVLHPDFPTTPWAYALYTHNALPGGSDPQWPSTDPDYANDYCPDPPGAMTDGCVVTGRLSRLVVDGPTQVTEHVLIENNWCQQFPSHSMGDLAFGPDGALYVTAGEGASFGGVDWGQYGGTDPDPILAPIPRNPCGDPPGGAMTPPTAEGGSLRAQDLRTPGDPVAYNGAVLRVDPETGAALPDNPLWGGAASDDDRVVAYGLRNPFRIAVRPGTTELWIGDVGWDAFEEIDLLADPTNLRPTNFGWPCFEGTGRQPAFDASNLAICESLYADMADTKPLLAVRHGEALGGDPACTTASSSVAGLAFYASGTYPSTYDNALFFVDYGRNCLWAMLPGDDGVPNPAALVTVGSGLPGPVSLERGPDGDLFYLEIGGNSWLDGAVHRIRYLGTNHPPVAVATADVVTGSSPLTVHFDASGSTDPDADAVLTFAWDLDGDGAFDDATGATPAFTFGPGTWPVRVQVTDVEGASDTAGLTVSVDNTPPTALITAPTPSERWSVGESITFAGSGLDAEQGTLPASALHWQIVLLHCPGFDCHAHLVQELAGVTGGEFPAPDHEYPSFLEIVLTVVDAGGLSHTTSVQLAPETANLHFDSVPSGLGLAVGAAAVTTPFSRDVIVGSQTSVAAVSPQEAGGTVYTFDSWSDGAPEAHNVVAPPGGGSWVAHFSSGSPTTTTTTLGTAPSSTSTTTTVAASDSTTTTTPDTTTTSTMVPIRCGGDAQCDDGDPCTIDRCAADVCTALPLTGLEGARCAVDRISSGLCRPGDLHKTFSGVLHKRVRGARKAILAAESAGTARRAKLLRIAERRMAALTRATQAAARKRRLVPVTCADRIGQAVSAAQQSIRLAASGS